MTDQLHKVHLVVPALNAAATLEACLKSILLQAGIGPQDVTVVDNGSTDATRTMAFASGVQVLDCATPGAGAARNVGIAAAREDPPRYLAFVDADVVLPADWLTCALDGLHRLGNNAAGVGGPGRSGGQSAAERLLDGTLWGWDRFGQRAHRVSSLATMDVVYRYEAVACRRFHEPLAAGEDPDFSFQLRDDGWDLWALPELVVAHHHVNSSSRLIRKWFGYGTYYIHPYLRHPRQVNLGVILRFAALPIALLAAAGGLALGRRRGLALGPPLALFAVPLGAYFVRLGRVGRSLSAGERLLSAALGSLRFSAHSLGVWYGIAAKPHLFVECVLHGMSPVAKGRMAKSEGEAQPTGDAAAGRLHVAHVGSKGIPSRGGTERVVEAVATRHALHHDVTVYGSARVCISGMRQGVQVVALPTFTAKHSGPVILQLLAALHALTIRQYDVVHVHASENGFVVPLLRLRYPVITTNHGSAYRLEKWGAVARCLIRANERLSVTWATIATAVAANQARALTGRYGRAVECIPNGVDEHDPVAIDEASDLLRIHGLERLGYVLFAAARVDPTKGCHTVLEAYRVMEAPPPLLVVGDLDHAPGYEERVRKLAEGLPVTFVPRLEDKAVLMGLLRLCRVFVFPSTIEAMSMMLLESLATGAVGIASDIQENVTVLPEGYPTFKAGDAADLGRQLQRVLELSDAEREAILRHGVEWVRARHDWDRIAVRYEGLYIRATRQSRAWPLTRVRESQSISPAACSGRRSDPGRPGEVLTTSPRELPVVTRVLPSEDGLAAEHGLVRTVDREIKRMNRMDVVPLVLNLGAGASTLLETTLARGGSRFIVDRVDIELTLVRHTHVRKQMAASLEDLSEIADDSYDLAFANYVMEHVHDVQSAVREMTRVVRPGSLLVLSMSNPRALEFRIARRSPRWLHRAFQPQGFDTVYAYRSVSGFVESLTANGMRLETCEYNPVAGTYLKRLSRLLGLVGAAYDSAAVRLQARGLCGGVLLAARKK